MINNENTIRCLGTPPGRGGVDVSVVAVGNRREWDQSGNQPPDATGIAFVSFEDISHSFFEDRRPSVIFSPVLARGFDCIDLAVLLHRLGFTGSYRAISRDLPNPTVIEAEVRAVCPNLDFKIMTAN